MVLPNKQIEEYIDLGIIKVERDDAGEISINRASVSVHLDNECRTMTPSTKVLDPFDEIGISNTFATKSGWSNIEILPGGFCLFLTKEELSIPKSLAGFTKSIGLLSEIGIDVHEKFLEPGFSGKLILEVTNTTRCPIKLYDGMRICQIVFVKMLFPPDDRL